MEFIQLLLASLQQQLAEQQADLENVVNSTPLEKTKVAKNVLREIVITKMSISELVSMMTPENTEK